MRPHIREALRTAVTPQIEQTKIVGLIALPGTMTGLLLAGVPPREAVAVQLAVMFLILGSVAITTVIVGPGVGRRMITSDQRSSSPADRASYAARVTDLGQLVPTPPDPDAVLDAFSSWVEAEASRSTRTRRRPSWRSWPGRHVIVDTPTGSGKSLIAVAAHFAALAERRRTYYTAPIKALVSEKFFDLSATFGADQVGMLTGDASVNPEAPIICCTAEILANLALREGSDADVGQVVMDEFHYFADPDRGWAWQVPLLELPHAQFVLMSATLGDVTRFTDRPAGAHRARRGGGALGHPARSRSCTSSA